MSFRQTQLGRSTTLQNILLGACGSILLAACGGGSSNSGGGGVTTQSYTVGGAVSGLTGSGLVLQDNGGDDKAVSASGTFTFATSVTSGLTYNVTVKTQPTSPAQTCTVTNGSGTIASANVTNVTVTCTTPGFTVGGSVSGLTGSGLVLEDNSGDDKAISANGAFTFATSLAAAATYHVTVKTQPTSQTCTVTNASGTIGSANVTNVAVTCAAASGPVTIGGTLSGLSGTGLVLQDNGGDSLPLTANGPFTFATALTSGATYSVSILTQPTATPAQFCTVAAGSGTAGSGNVTNVAVTCRKTGRYLITTVHSSQSSLHGMISWFDIDPSTGIPSRQLRQGATSVEPNGITLDASGPYAYVAFENDPADQIRSEKLTPGSPPTIVDTDFVPLGANALMISAATDTAPSSPYVYFGGAPDYTHTAGQIYAYAVNSTTGVFTAKGTASMDGGYPYSLAVDPAGKLLFAPQPAGGAVPTPQSGSGDIWVFQIAADGTLTPATGAPFTYQSGGTTNTPFAVAVDPNGGFVYFTDDTANTVTAYSYTAAGALTEVGTPQATGGKPTGVAIDPSGQFLYVTNSTDATVSAFTINVTTGALTAVGSAVSTGANGSTGSATAIQVDPSGQFVYVATGDDATIAAFQINRTTGALTEVGSVAGDAQSVAGVGNMGAGASALAID